VTRRIHKLLAPAAATALAVVGLGSFGVPPATADGNIRYVATTGSDTANNCLTLGSPCLTIGHALTQATFDNTIQLDPGTYLVSANPSGTSNSVPPALHDLIIQSNPVGGTAANTIIDATGEANGLLINADTVSVTNLTIRNAERAGIVAGPPEDSEAPTTIHDVTLTGDVLTDNNACQHHPQASNCLAQVSELLPFGWGIELTSVINSTVTGNTLTGNWGGIEVGDELGPSHDITISGNTLFHNGGARRPGGDNLEACGICLIGTNSLAVTPGGVPQPILGGVFHDTVSGNTVDDSGAVGISLEGSTTQNAVYSNTITGNTANDNGGAGIAIKSLGDGQYLNNNVITGNHLSHDALELGPGPTGTTLGPGDIDAAIVKTTAIIVLAFSQAPEVSAGAPITGTVVTGNTISDVATGVWISQHTPKANVSGNVTTVDPGGSAIVVQRRTIAPIVGVARTPSGHGYWEVQSDGNVFPFGDAGYYGSVAGTPLAKPIVGIAATTTGRGYWLVASDGGIFSIGDAGYFGSTGAIRLNRPIVGMTAGSGGLGYWLVASDGGIFSFGTAKFHGSTGAIHLNQPIVGMASGAGGAGYWLVASDGGIFSFGSAKFHGSTGAIHLTRPIVGMAAGPSGAGYWLVASDGGAFSFGSAKFHGSTGAIKLVQPIAGMAATPTGLGYWLGARDGGIFAFPDAHYFGSEPGNASPFDGEPI
jgi:parallel beta-helix repeat protein